MGADSPIRNVSDTARWVAVYRADESKRPDALFRDPFAERLAGERGRAVADQLPRSMKNGWPMVTRTRLIDDLIAAALAEGCDRVLNLAAGLDTRPYRMDLPASLEWIEADLGPMIDEKEKLLEGEKPRCVLRRERVDLADASARDAFLARATAGAKNVLVVTEGLLIYLDDEAVRAVARSLLARPEIRGWVLDLTGPAIRDMVRKTMGAHLDGAPMKFAPPDGVAFFEAVGWKAREILSTFREGVRLRRVPAILRTFAFLPEPDPRKPGSARWAGVIRFERGR